MGVKPDKHRGAAYFGSYYSRDKRTATVHPDAHGGGKRGFGIGLTAVVRVGPPDKLHSVAPVVIGIDIHAPTSGSIEGLENAIGHAKRNTSIPVVPDEPDCPISPSTWATTPKRDSLA